MDLSVDFLGVRFANPTILASGILGVTKASLRFCAANGAGGVTIKSITREPREGHALPIMVSNGHGLLNAVGYSNPGWEAALEEYADLSAVGAPVIGSFVAETPADYAFLAENFAARLPFDMVEIPLSCPHTPGFGEMAGHTGAPITREIVSGIKAVLDKPLIVKLSANLQGIGEIAAAAAEAGADAINAVNTLGPGTCIDPVTGRKILGFGNGGVSGPPLKPVALRAVFDVRAAVDLPIVATGGVATGQDAIEMIMAGATMVGVGTAVATRGVGVFGKIAKEIEDHMTRHGIPDLDAIRGIAHD